MKFYLFTYCLLTIGLCYSQNKKVELSVSSNDVEVGEVFNITVTSTVQGELDIDNLPSSYIQDYGISQGSNQVMDHNTGTVTTTIFTSYTGIITKSGNYKIGPAYVKAGNKVYPSNTVTINVGSKTPMTTTGVSNKQLNDPAFGVIESNKSEIFEGEPVLIAAKIYAQYDPSHISGYQSYDLNSTVKKNQIGHTNNIKVSEERFKGKRYYTFSYDKNIVFPDGIGKFQIDPFTLNLHQGHKSFPITSNGLIIKIKPLPANAPKNFIGGVGKFKIETSIDNSEINQGDVILFQVTISGVGNLQNLTNPVLNLPKGFSIYGDPIIEENYNIGTHGADGSVTFKYNLQVSEHGQLTIPSTAISYFDIDKELYLEIASTKHIVNTKKNDAYIVHSKKSNNSNQTELISTKIPENSNLLEGTFFKKILLWSSIPVIGFIFLLIIRKKKPAQKPEESNSNNLKNKSEELSSLISKIKIEAVSNQNDLFYANIEKTILLHFELIMNLATEKIQNRQQIFGYLKNAHEDHKIPLIEEVFQKIDVERYGIASSSDSKKEILAQVLSIIEQ